MKKIYSSVLLAVTLLLSTNIWAESTWTGTAKLDGGDSKPIADLISDWQTKGGVLQLQSACTYTTDATFNVTGTNTLDLNGQNLIWNAGADVANAISIGANGNLTISGNDAVQNVLSFDCQRDAAVAISSANALAVKGAKIASKGSNGVVVKVTAEQGAFSIENSAIELGDNMKFGIDLAGTAEGVSSNFTNVKISCTGNEHSVFGAAAIYTKRQCTFENLCIDMSGYNEQKACYGIRLIGGDSKSYIKGENTSIKMNNHASSVAVRVESRLYLTIDAGEFTAPSMLGSNGYIVPTRITINGGKYSTMLPYNVNTPAGQILRKGSDGYYALTAGAYKFAITTTKVGYLTAEDCWKDCADATATKATTVKILANENFSIGEAYSDRYIQFSQTADAAYSGTITNYAKVILGKFQWDNVTIENYGTLMLNTAATYGDNFKINNHDNASVVVTNGLFTAKSIEQVRPYLQASGVEAALQSDGYYHIVKDVVFKVGDTSYGLIKDALIASAKENKPAILQKDYTVSRISLSALTGEAQLDLNGKTLTLKMDKSSLENAHLTISNGTLSCTDKGGIFDLYGSTDLQTTDYTVLTIAKDVTVEVPTTDDKTYFVSVGYDETKVNGVVVNFNGTYKGMCPFYIFGQVTTISENSPTFNVGSTANFTSNSLAYAAGYGIWNYAGEATTSHHGFELRAGKLNVTGGSIVCTSDAPADDQGNGSGSTSQASAIAACQHGTRLPVEINISGGEFEAYTPLYQANTEKNPQEAYNKVKVTVTGGKFKATKGSKNVVWSENKKVALEGGVYNMNPSAYAANGKVAVENTGADKDVYPYAISDVDTEGATFTTEGDWNVAGNWQDSKMASATTPVSIGANVVIPAGVTAEAYKITVAWGKTITVKSGAILVIGVGGINIAGGQAKQLVVEDGAALLINPAATVGNQPVGIVCKTLNTYKKAPEKLEEGEAPYVRLHVGIPTTALPSISNRILVSAWNTATGWYDAPEFATPFKGYDITTETTPAEATQFGGTLVGNMDAALSMPRIGFHFFGNSWSAPVDATELLNQLDALKNQGKVEAAVKVHNSDDTYTDITRDAINNDQTLATLAPMAGFFLFANEAVSVPLSYEKAVWNANAQSVKKSAAPKRMMVAAEEETNAVRIMLTAANGRKDNVYLYDGNEFHSTKMMNGKPNVNIFVEEGQSNYSTFASEDLEGTVIGIQTNSQTNYSLSFDWLRGEPLYIKDLQTGIVTAMTEGAVYNFTATANETSRRFIISRHNAPTAIDEVMVNTAAKGVYSITGQYLGESSVLETLPQGIYVVDGQKYIK